MPQMGYATDGLYVYSATDGLHLYFATDGPSSATNGRFLPLMVFYPHVCFEAEMEEHRGGGGSQNWPARGMHSDLG